ncbi:MAG TPA: hypothetical protein PKE07_12450 [Lacibacter sp.]|nr:hypothetical protein [Lacibacter sp.]HMO89976.1 hypothetical protein [Lacibacter sp.]
MLASILPGGIFTQRGCQRTLQKINEAYTSLGLSYTYDKLVAELSFGTWKFLFAGKQFQAGGNTLLSISPSLPRYHNQGDIYAKLNRINIFRNRVAHHESICFGAGNTIGTAYARSHFQDIVDLLNWMDIPHHELFFGIDGVLKEAVLIDAI